MLLKDRRDKWLGPCGGVVPLFKQVLFRQSDESRWQFCKNKAQYYAVPQSRDDIMHHLFVCWQQQVGKCDIQVLKVAFQLGC